VWNKINNSEREKRATAKERNDTVNGSGNAGDETKMS
jgi:hypothetical protein